MNVLLLLALPERGSRRVSRAAPAAFPEVTINLAEHHEQGRSATSPTPMCSITFGAHMADRVLEQGVRLRWIQALGTGVDGIADSPALRAGMLVTNLHGLHGPAVSESVLASMLALARDLPRSMANQQRGALATISRCGCCTAKPSASSVSGCIAEELAPKCSALGMRVVGCVVGATNGARLRTR